jgi:PAS domain S-box-containing protein
MAVTTTRRSLSASAQDRLRRHVLLGVSITGMLLGMAGATFAIADGAIDPGVVGLFAPDIAIGLVVGWQVLAQKRLDTAVNTYAAYFALSGAFLALHADGCEVFQQPWVVLPPVVGFYLGGRRLGVLLTAVTCVEGLVAAIVHQVGIGHRLVELPPMTDPSVQIVIALGTIEVLCLVNIFERRRDRTRVELDSALGELDRQTQTMVALVESTSDAILLIDERHRVVMHNRAASELVPGIEAGVSAAAVLAGETRDAWAAWLDACARHGHARAEHSIAGRVFELSFSRVAAADRVIGFTLIARDITARRETEAALRKMRGQLLDASRRAGVAETAAALVHNVGNALNGAMVASGVIADHVSGLRVESLRRAIDEIDRGALERSGERASKLRAYLRGLADYLSERKTVLVEETRSLRASVDDVAAALGRLQLVQSRAVFDDVSLDEVVASALTADDCQVSRDLAPTGAIVTDRQRLVQIVAELFSVCRGDGMHVALRPLVEGVALSISPARRTTLGGGIFAHGKPLHEAALAASALGGSLRCEDARERESFVLELPRIAPCAPARPPRTDAVVAPMTA